MKPGDLVRVDLGKNLQAHLPQWHGKVGIIIKFAWRGSIPVWWVLLEGGVQQGFEEHHLELINAS